MGITPDFFAETKQNFGFVNSAKTIVQGLSLHANAPILGRTGPNFGPPDHDPTRLTFWRVKDFRKYLFIENQTSSPCFLTHFEC